MTTTRRTFIKHTAFAGGGTVLSGGILAKGLPEFRKHSPGIGACTQIETSSLIDNSGCAYIEEYVREFLIPDRPEGEFLQKLDLARKSKLPILACNSFLPGGMKSVGPDAVHEAILSFAETAFRRAALAGIKFIVFGSGASRAIPEGFSKEEARRQLTNLLKQMSLLAEKYGVMIVLEPLNTHVCNFINSLAEGAEMVRDVNHPNFQLVADIYHMRVDGEDPSEIVNNGLLIRHVHIAEIKDYSAPGTHGDDFRPYLAALKKIKYKGSISIECTWKDLKNEVPVAIQTIKDQWPI